MCCLLSKPKVSLTSLCLTADPKYHTSQGRYRKGVVAYCDQNGEGGRAASPQVKCTKHNETVQTTDNNMECCKPAKPQHTPAKHSNKQQQTAQTSKNSKNMYNKG